MFRRTVVWTEKEPNEYRLTRARAQERDREREIAVGIKNLLCVPLFPYSQYKAPGISKFREMFSGSTY